jgi:hypothetical protein
MKTLLGCLMCLVFTLSQSFAISGGPFGGRGHVRTTGTYAGLFVPTGVNSSDNSLGLFTATVPKTGLATGTLALFRNGIFYPGTIQAIADPDSAVLTGVVSSSFNITFTSETSGNPPTTTNIVITFNANGSVKGNIRANTLLLTAAAARINGTAAITYATVGSAPGFNSDPANSNGPIDYKVKGFKQAEATQ